MRWFYRIAPISPMQSDWITAQARCSGFVAIARARTNKHRVQKTSDIQPDRSFQRHAPLHLSDGCGQGRFSNRSKKIHPAREPNPSIHKKDRPDAASNRLSIQATRCQRSRSHSRPRSENHCDRPSCNIGAARANAAGLEPSPSSIQAVRSL